MKPDEGLTEAAEPGFHAVRCLLCHRMRSAESSELAAPQWDKLPELLHRYRIGLPEVFVSDTYCDECVVFYHQLMTYGHPGQGLGVWGALRPPVM